MRRPSFQFYHGDWRSNANLRRCSFAERGVWIETMCLLGDSDEFGVLRWPLKELAQALGCKVSDLQALRDKKVLKGADAGEHMQALTYTPRHAGKVGTEVTLLPAQPGPIWYSSRMVRDEYVRTLRATQGHADSPPKGGIGDNSGEHLSRAQARVPAQSASSSPSEKKPPKPTVGLKPDDVRKGADKRQANDAASRSIEYLNAQAGTRFRLTDSNIRFGADRILYDAATEEDLRAVVDAKVAESRAGNFDAKYLRPETLWNKTKFASYIGLIGVTKAAPAPTMVKAFAERESGEQQLVIEYKANGLAAEAAARKVVAQHAKRFLDFGARNIVLDNGRGPVRFSLEELEASAS